MIAVITTANWLKIKLCTFTGSSIDTSIDSSSDNMHIFVFSEELSNTATPEMVLSLTIYIDMYDD